jgi:hypothetical protein
MRCGRERQGGPVLGWSNEAIKDNRRLQSETVNRISGGVLVSKDLRTLEGVLME